MPARVYWPPGVSDCRPAGQAKFSRAARAEQRWFLQSLLVQELRRDGGAADADLERVQITPEALKMAVDAELYAEDFPDTLQFVVDAVSPGCTDPIARSKSHRDSFRAALLEILGFCDEATAHTALGLLKYSSVTVRDFADSVGCLLEHEGSAVGEVCRKLQALLWLQKASSDDLILGLDHIGSAITALLECGLGHADASCRARTADVVLQAGLHSREHNRAAGNAAVAVLCRSALYDAENRPFLLSAAWDLLLVHPSSSFATLNSSTDNSGCEASADSMKNEQPTTVLAFLLGFLRVGQRDKSPELEAACITGLGAAKLIMHHTDLESAEVIQCRLNAALVQCRRIDEIRNKNNQRHGSGNISRAPRAGKDKGANPLRIILEEFEIRFKQHCNQLGMEEVRFPVPLHFGWVS